ncbi:hypothetical protein SEUCBS139899_004570 [Sporothrix eucalyptigena]|uniref:DNA replication regulator SLD2 n=1 Tax=Sporothrix eucalyptigena TaxID=1812306 RepID=A0ABP0CY90_9PEZI
MLDVTERATVEAESQQLRLALKTWETTWAREHGGAKPARGDISRNPEIAKKYKAYNHTRAVLSGKIATSDAKKDETRRKRKQELPPPTASAPAEANTQSMQTPSKRLRATVTRATPSRTAPSATPTQVGGGYLDAHLNMTPSISRKLFSPVVPTSIGPTPQRDGRVLGLFDVLNEEEEKRKKRSAVAATPSKQTAAEADTIKGNKSQPAGQVSVAVLGATPRKQTLNVEAYKSDDDDEDNAINARRLGRTPMSSGRRNLLNHFTAGGGGVGPVSIGGGNTTTRETSGVLGSTPLKPRNNDNQTTHQKNLLTTPSKGNSDGLQHAFSTPAFLRRQSSALPPVDENGEFMSPPGKLRLPRKPLMRGLSNVLASLRKAEDEQLDEQLDMLRDLEDGMDMNAPPPPPSRRPSTKASQPVAKPTYTQPAPGVQIQDSQLQEQQDLDQQELEMHELELHEQEQAKLKQQNQLLGPDHAAGGLLGGFDDEGLYDSPPEDQVGRDGQPLRVYKKKGQKRTTRLFNIRPTRTKRPAAGTMAENETDSENEGDGNGGDDVDASGSEFGSDAEGAAAARKAVKAKKVGTDKTTDGPVKKAVRKVNELAHANFKRLKLRNNGAKGGPGFNSRFRRRR